MDYEDLPSNAKNPRQPRPDAERPKAQKVISSSPKTKRPSVTKIFKENFIADDSQTILEFVISDVVVPSIKGIITDTVTESIQRLMWGSGAPRKTSSYAGSVMKIGGSSNANYNYSKVSQPVSRPLTPQARSKHDFREIILDNRSEAVDVIDRLNELIENYGDATVADLYDFVGVESSYTDRKWGWMNLRGAQAVRVREGFLIDLPRPNELR